MNKVVDGNTFYFLNDKDFKKLENASMKLQRGLISKNQYVSFLEKLAVKSEKIGGIKNEF